MSCTASRSRVASSKSLDFSADAVTRACSSSLVRSASRCSRTFSSTDAGVWRGVGRAILSGGDAAVGGVDARARERASGATGAGEETGVEAGAGEGIGAGRAMWKDWCEMAGGVPGLPKVRALVDSMEATETCRGLFVLVFASGECGGGGGGGGGEGNAEGSAEGGGLWRAS